MASSIGQIDAVKIKAHLEDANTKLHFLSHINSKNDASSELAGFEINKLLKEQTRLEGEYANLLTLRSTLKGITNKRKADQVQEQIQGAARDLKESTKKLCRMFRENPDLASDAEKIKRERMSVIEELETLITNLAQPNLQPFLERMASSLHDQDTFRQLNQDEKMAIANIKELRERKKAKWQEFQDELAEKEKTLAGLKEDFLRAKTEAEIATKYESKVLKADEGTTFRTYKQQIADLNARKLQLTEKQSIELQVAREIMEFMNEKKRKIMEENQEFNAKRDQRTTEIDEKIRVVKEEHEKLQAELAELNMKIEEKELVNQEKRKAEEEEEARKEQERQEKERLAEAVGIIQREFTTWADANAKPKKPKSAKKKKKR